MASRSSNSRSGGGRPGRRAPQPLDPAALEAIALRYVGRYATTRAKLLAYLDRKLRERGWSGEQAPAPQALADRFVALGYVDDRAFAAMRGAALVRRGFGPRRVGAALRAAGVSEDDGGEASDAAARDALVSTLTLVRRRRLGPYADAAPDRPARERLIAVLIRAGHEFALARKIADMSRTEADDLLHDNF